LAETASPPRKTWLSRGFTCHEAANEFASFPITTEASQLQPLRDNSSQLLGQVHRLGGWAVLYDAGIAVGKDHKVTGVDSDALRIQQPGRGLSLGEQVVDDYVSCARRQIGRNRAEAGEQRLHGEENSPL